MIQMSQLYESEAVLQKTRGTSLIFFLGDQKWENEKILQLQWKHLKYYIIICHNFHAIFHVLKAAPMPVFSASGDDSMRIMPFSETVPIPKHFY